MIISVILRQSLAAEREPSRSPEMGVDPEEPQVLPILRALPQSCRAGFLPHWEDQVSQLVLKGCQVEFVAALQLAFYYTLLT